LTFILEYKYGKRNMVTAIRIPDLGTNTDEVKLVEWLKQEGDSVKRGEML